MIFRDKPHPVFRRQVRRATTYRECLNRINPEFGLLDHPLGGLPALPMVWIITTLQGMSMQTSCEENPQVLYPQQLVSLAAVGACDPEKLARCG